MSPGVALVGFVGLALLVGVADGAIASGAARLWYISLHRPFGAVPDSLFGPIWAFLYLCCGLGGWLAWRRGIERPARTTAALRLWGWALAATAARAAFFFGVRSPLLALTAGVVVLGLLLLVVRVFAALHRGAASLMVPSLLWTGYILYLDAGFWMLNPG